MLLATHFEVTLITKARFMAFSSDVVTRCIKQNALNKTRQTKTRPTKAWSPVLT
jgi:hypothetical protein